MLWCALTTPFHPYFLRKRYLSVALALGSPPVVVNNYPALRCSDFPHGRNQSSTLPYSSLTLLFYKKTSHISSTIFRESENFLCWKKESTSIFPPYVLNIRNTYQQFQASSVFKPHMRKQSAGTRHKPDKGSSFCSEDSVNVCA